MPLKIVRNDITRMNTEAVVNTANMYPTVGSGCDTAIYTAAGYEQLLSYRKEKIGIVPEGEVFITPGFNLRSKYIIHAVSPLYQGGDQMEEEKLRSCYRKSLQLAREHGIRSIAFPLISTGSFGYPREEGLRIAVDEIKAFPLARMFVYLVVFDSRSVELGEKLYPGLERYIDQKYVDDRLPKERGRGRKDRPELSANLRRPERKYAAALRPVNAMPEEEPRLEKPVLKESFEEDAYDFVLRHESRLQERMKHVSDTFSQYLLYLIREKGMENAEVYKRAIVDKKTFSKIKNNADYHPQKLTAMCLCIGAKLNMDESRDLLARAGYALSPCEKTDIIFSYFIENGIYDMIELDIQLEEHGQHCIIQ